MDLRDVLFKPLVYYSAITTLVILALGGVLLFVVNQGREAGLEIERLSAEREVIESNLEEIKRQNVQKQKIAESKISDVREEARSVTNDMIDFVPIYYYTNALAALDVSERLQSGMRDEIDALILLRRADAKDASLRSKKHTQEVLTGITIAGAGGVLVGALLVALIKK